MRSKASDKNTLLISIIGYQLDLVYNIYTEDLEMINLLDLLIMKICSNFLRIDVLNNRYNGYRIYVDIMIGIVIIAS